MPPGDEYAGWRDLERIERQLEDIRKECRDNKSMSREDIIDRLSLLSTTLREALVATQNEAKSRSEINEKAITGLRSLIERVIFAVIGSLAAGVLSLLIEIIRLLAPRPTGP